MLTTRRDRPQRYTARLEVHLDQATQTTITRFVTVFRRSRAAVLRHVLEWGLTQGQGWTIDRHRPSGRTQRASLRLEPELRERLEAAATAAGGDISAWLRHAVHLVTVADFPASWQAASAEQGRVPQRERDSRTYHERFMLRLDDASRGKLDEFTRFFVTSRAEVIRQLIMQATPKVFPKSWHLAAEERRQRQAHQAEAQRTPQGTR
jgi:predicted transcriptional regulator